MPEVDIIGETGSAELEIREARADELDDVAAVAVDAYAEYAARMSPDAWSMFAQDIANVRGRLVDAELLVATRAGRITGTVTRYPDWRGAQPGASSVRMLAVPPAQRGTGVGSALMRACVERSRSEGKRRIVVTVAGEMTSIRDLNHKLGFHREPALDHEPAPGVRLFGYALDLDA